MNKSLVLLSGAVLALGVGAAQGGELYGGAPSMGAQELAGTTGMFAQADSFSHGGNGNLTGQINAQGKGVFFGTGVCTGCSGTNTNSTSQSASSSSSSTASNTSTVNGNSFVFSFTPPS